MNIFRITTKSTGATAKNRLEVILASDRLKCSDSILENIKNDILQVMKKYMEIEEETFNVEINNNRNNPSFDLSAQVKKVARN